MGTRKRKIRERRKEFGFGKVVLNLKGLIFFKEIEFTVEVEDAVVVSFGYREFFVSFLCFLLFY